MSDHHFTGVSGVPALIAGRYRVRGLLGSGGFANVHLAYDEKAHAAVAIKMVPIGSARATQQFRHEARALSSLDHPNIVRVLDVWDDEGMGALVMEFLAGRTLDARLRESVSPAAALEYVSSICEALDHAHGRNVVHRDVTPRNIIVTEPTGTAKLIDFGLSVGEFSGARVAGGTRWASSSSRSRSLAVRRPRVSGPAGARSQRAREKA